MSILLKRVYLAPHAKDGLRILIDRLWPRGISKENAKIDVWLKTIAPSAELRTWFKHDPKKWPAFRKKYFAELDANSEAVHELLGYIKKKNATFLYSSKEEKYNNAVALRDYVSAILKK